RRVADVDAGGAVAQLGTAGVGADVVAQHYVAGRARPGNLDAEGGVVTDGVGCIPGPADRVVRRVADHNAGAHVAQDVTAQHHVAGLAGPGNIGAVGGVV